MKQPLEEQPEQESLHSQPPQQMLPLPPNPEEWPERPELSQTEKLEVWAEQDSASGLLLCLHVQAVWGSWAAERSVRGLFWVEHPKPEVRLDVRSQPVRPRSVSGQAQTAHSQSAPLSWASVPAEPAEPLAHSDLPERQAELPDRSVPYPDEPEK